MTSFTQNTSIFRKTNVAINFAANNDTWTIGPDAIVSASDNTAVFSNKSGSGLINNGNIHAGFDGVFQGHEYYGVVFNSAGNHITNNGNIIGVRGAIFLQGPGTGSTAVVDNHGTIMGLAAAGVTLGQGTSGVILNNDGDIFGQRQGVFTNSEHGGNVINNSGLIRSHHDGILVDTPAGTSTTINNAVGATIKGADSAISTSQFGFGVIVLDNRGTIGADLKLAAAGGNDHVASRGTISGSVFLGSGNDVFDGKGGTSGAIHGGDGNDTITPGKGHVDMFGENGADTFKFVTAKGLPTGIGRDSIQDFDAGEGDRLDFSALHVKHHAHLKFIGSEHFHDHAGEVRLKAGILSADLDGDGKGEVQIALTGVTGLTSGADLILHL